MVDITDKWFSPREKDRGQGEIDLGVSRKMLGMLLRNDDSSPSMKTR